MKFGAWLFAGLLFLGFFWVVVEARFCRGFCGDVVFS
jgi:hypothetical protein